MARCPFCQQEFSNYTFRRHHCRLCGRVVCGDSRTGCSSEVGLNVAASMSPPLICFRSAPLTCRETDNITEKPVGQISVEIRMCKDCTNVLFSRRDFAMELARKPPDLKAYENLVEFERGIRQLMPRFQRLLVALQHVISPHIEEHIADSSTETPINHQLRPNWPTLPRSANASWTLSPNTTSLPAAFAIFPPIHSPNKNFNKPSIVKQPASCTYTCCPSKPCPRYSSMPLLTATAPRAPTSHPPIAPRTPSHPLSTTTVTTAPMVRAKRAAAAPFRPLR